MEINFTLALPQDALSVPVVRRVLRTTMNSLGVLPDCVSDIEVALTEACTNVLNHAGDKDAYRVVARVVEDQCIIDVIDTGSGFDAVSRGLSDAESGAEDGRGIQLIRSLVDSVRFTQGHDDNGTVVHFEKRLGTTPDSPLHRLALRP